MAESLEETLGQSKGLSLLELKKKGRFQLRSGKKKEDNDSGLASFESIDLEELDLQPQKVGLAYDDDDVMIQPCCTWAPKYPEKPDRIKLPFQRCQELGLIDRCRRLKCEPATDEELEYYHTPEYIADVKATQTMDESQLKQFSAKFEGIYFHNKTYDASILAAGCCLEIVDQLIEKKIKHGMALIRPPGHHAMADQSNGYCFFNNCVLAAKYALNVKKLKRILIIDWDVHHGQGIQQAFYDDKRVLYFSIHRYEHGAFWPSLRASEYDQLGEGKGQGYNINVPTNETGLTDGDYLAIFQQLLLPVAYDFFPQLVIVANGYDAAIGDPEGCSNVTPAAYAHFINMLKPLANGRLAVFLEGGYCMSSLAEGVALTLRSLLDDPCPDLGPVPPPKQSTVESILQSIRVLRPYWRGLSQQSDAVGDEELPTFFSDVIVPKPGFKEPNYPEEHKFNIHTDYLIHKEEVAKEFDIKIQKIIDETVLYTPPNRTCYVYDQRMKNHKAITGSCHPERPERISRIYNKMEECGILKRCKAIEARYATSEEIKSMHSLEHIYELKEALSIFDTEEEPSIKDIAKREKQFVSIYLSKDAWDCASLALGSTLNVVDEVCSGASLNGVAIVRPPGHHAEPDQAMGFCYFNTVAIAARYAQKKHGVKRVLILDWDVHHGNGTQKMFEEDPNVLYISLHRFDYGWFFPTNQQGNFDKVGKGAGIGFNVNIPWNTRGVGDGDYLAAFTQIIMPIAYEFNPDLVLVSAGFDAARGDPLGGCCITPEGFGHMTRYLMGLASGKVILVLEGGYNLFSISECMTACASVLLGDLCLPINLSLIPLKSGAESLRDVMKTHSKYWKCMQYSVLMPSRGETRKWLGDETTPAHEKKPDVRPKGTSEAPEVTSEVPKVTSEMPKVTSEVPKVTSEAPKVTSEAPKVISRADIDSLTEELARSQIRDDLNTNVKEGQETSTDGKNDKETSNVTSNAGSSESPSGLSEALSLEGSSEVGPERSREVGPSETSLEASAAESAELGACGGACGGASGVSLSGSIPAEFLKKDALGNKSVEMFAVAPKHWCPQVDKVMPVPIAGINVNAPCGQCGSTAENWVCLTCYQVLCGRYVEEHMVQHNFETDHPIVLSFSDLSVWCYACDDYVSCEEVTPAKRAAHISKFGEDLPGY